MPELNAAMAKLDLPARMRGLPISDRGFPVPWFVGWVDGKPDFRCIREGGVGEAHRRAICWLCGQPLGKYRTFVIGPMCAINRTISEPPSHLDCARFAAIACPFLANPRAQRNGRHLPEERDAPPGDHITRNPGAICLWTCMDYRPFPVDHGVLFRLGQPTRQPEWYAEGGKASAAQVMESLRTGLPLLLDMARRQGPDAVEELGRMTLLVAPMLPAGADATQLVAQITPGVSKAAAGEAQSTPAA